MANDSEVIRTLAWSALLFLFYRSLSACSILFISINATVFVGSSIQVASRSESAPITTRKRASKPDPNGCDGRAVAVPARRSNSKCYTEEQIPYQVFLSTNTSIQST